MPIIPWGWEFSGGPMSCTHVFNLGSSWPDPLLEHQDFTNHTAPKGKIKERGKNKANLQTKKDRQNPKANGKSNINQTGRHKEVHQKKKNKNKKRKRKRKRAIRPINKPINENQC